jgi:hypothetical protein
MLEILQGKNYTLYFVLGSYLRRSLKLLRPLVLKSEGHLDSRKGAGSLDHFGNLGLKVYSKSTKMTSSEIGLYKLLVSLKMVSNLSLSPNLK